MKIYCSFLIVLFCIIALVGCDLQPKITSIPDSIGEFIQNRYPALLADPESQPEIYNSAVTDYGVYASPELYGSDNVNDYVMYASVDDYVLVPHDKQTESSVIQEEQKIEQEIQQDYIIVPVYGGFSDVKENINEEKQKNVKINQDDDVVVVAKGDTLYSLARKYDMTVADFAKINNLQEPYILSIGQRLRVRQSGIPVAKQPMPNVISEEKVKEIKAEKIVETEPIKPNTTKRVDLQEITVAKGDTLYSLSRKYQIPVNDMAVMNKLSAPFTLSVGQKIKVPKLDNVQTRSAIVVKTEQKASFVNTDKKVTEKQSEKSQTPQKTPVTAKQQTKISSNPKTQLPKISVRSGSKFSWPVRGKILSAYGAKNSGLFNDGINIGATRGTDVKAAENGVVAYAGNEVKGMGNLIIMQHSDGWMTVYAHLDSMSVKRGNVIKVGQSIGKVGMTGKVDKPQLHFEIRKGTKAYNPTQYLQK